MPGAEGPGAVEEVGLGVIVVKKGDRVAYAMARGAYAEYAVVHAEMLVPIPEGIDFKMAAAAMLHGMTAHYLAISTYPLDRGNTALVHAGAGGAVGLFIQAAQMPRPRLLTPV